jgi:hypothetical protein
MERSVKPNLPKDDFQVLWGAPAIADDLGSDVRRVYYLLRNGRFRGAARKIGSAWVAERGKLRGLFTEEEAADARETAP